MTTAIVCDDEPRLAESLQHALATAWPELQLVGVGHSGGEALALVDEHAPDIAFLDIRMPGLSGLEVARQLAGGDRCPRIVFVTAYDNYAVQAFESRAVDYVLKPVKPTRLAETVARLQQSLEKTAPQIDAALLHALDQLRTTAPRNFLRWLNCGQGNEIDVIATSEVLYFQSRDKYTAVITADKERYIRKTLKDLINELDPHEFWQVHRSAAIRVGAIERVVRDDLGRMQVLLKGHPEKLPVSGTFSGQFKQM